MIILYVPRQLCTSLTSCYLCGDTVAVICIRMICASLLADVSVGLLSPYVCAADNFVIAKYILPATPAYNILSIHAATLEYLFGLNVENTKMIGHNYYGTIIVCANMWCYECSSLWTRTACASSMLLIYSSTPTHRMRYHYRVTNSRVLGERTHRIYNIL